MRKEINVFQFCKETNLLLRDEGVFLVSKGSGKPNIMTIGWGFLGTFWRRPVFIVAVRHSRYTYELLEASSSFTVCLPGRGMEKALEVCGTKSGREIDKFKELGLTPSNSYKVEAPFIEECPVHYECEIIYKHGLEAEGIPREVVDEIYPSGNLHTLYYGEVKGVYAVEGAGEALKKWQT